MGHLFCVQCRGKLDLKSLPKSAFKSEVAGGARGWFVVLAVLLGCFGLCLALALWPAEGTSAKWTESDVQQVYKKINALMRGSALAPQVFHEREANALFGSLLRKKDFNRASGMRGVSLISVRARFRPGAIVLHSVSMWGPVTFGRRSFGPLKLTHEINILPIMEEGRIAWVARGGRMGHLPLPGPAAYLAGMFLEPLRMALLPDRAILVGISRFELEESRVVVGFNAGRENY